MKKFKIGSDGNDSERGSWLKKVLEKVYMDECISKVLSFYHIPNHRYYLIEDLYAKLVQTIYDQFATHLYLMHEPKFLEKLFRLYQNVVKKETTNFPRMQQMGRELFNV